MEKALIIVAWGSIVVALIFAATWYVSAKQVEYPTDPQQAATAKGMCGFAKTGFWLFATFLAVSSISLMVVFN